MEKLQSLSDSEFLSLLAEAKAIQQRYGTSLKDACHRLYLSETMKLDTIDAAEKSTAAIISRLDKIKDEEIIPPIAQIDSGAFDNYILPYGGWPALDAAETAMDFK
jgi:hypothetical protein